MASTTPCPICEKPPISAHAPFCSKRCAELDLHKWLNGSYTIPTEEEMGDEMGLESEGH